MKRVAISVRSKNGLESAIDPRFGRAPAFVIVDVEKRKVVAEFDNDFFYVVQGAGAGAAAKMSKEGVNAVISGSFEPKECTTLQMLGIDIWLAPDSITAEQALERLVSGLLQQMKVKVR